MREIKFRAWNGKMHYDVMIGKVVGSKTMPPTPIGEANLMQFTGLKDKNGKEIYEGDTVRIADPAMWTDEWIKDFKGNAEVEWVEDGCEYWVHFRIDIWLVLRGCEWDSAVTEIESENLEVIGNKYENPELLKQ